MNRSRSIMRQSLPVVIAIGHLFGHSSPDWIKAVCDSDNEAEVIQRQMDEKIEAELAEKRSRIK